MSERMEAEELSDEESTALLVEYVQSYDKKKERQKLEITARSNFLQVQGDNIERISKCLDIVDAAWHQARSIKDVCELVKATTHLISERSKAMILPHGHQKDAGGVDVYDAFDESELN